MGGYDDEYLEPLEPWDDGDEEEEECPYCGAKPGGKCMGRDPIDCTCPWVEGQTF